MTSFLALPAEVQLEILTRCTYASLKQLLSTCSSLRNTIAQATVLDARLFRSAVDPVLLKQTREQYAKDLATVEKIKSKEEKNAMTERLGMEYRGARPVELHPLLDACVSFADKYESIYTFFTPHASRGKPYGERESDQAMVHELAAARENATNPPVSEMTLMDDKYHTDVVVKNMHVTGRLGRGSQKGIITISNEKHVPVTVEQETKQIAELIGCGDRRSYCFYSQQSLKLCYRGRMDNVDHTFLEGWMHKDLAADNSVVLSCPFYGS